MKTLWIALTALFTIGAIIVTIPFIIRGVIFQPPTTPLNEIKLPAGIKLIEVRTADGLNIAGLFVEPKAQKPIILMFHGNAYGAADAAAWFRPITDAGYGLIAAEYRGYSGNPGRPSQGGVAQDADALLTYANRVSAGRRLIIVGHSLGGGVALDLATRHKLDLLITIGTFTGIKPLAPPLVRPLAFDPFDNQAAVQGTDGPLYIIHGTQDEVIPFDHGQSLYAAVTANRVGGLITLPGEMHQPDIMKILRALEIAEAGRDEKADPNILFKPFTSAPLDAITP
jgi:uncharacterized protein